MSSQRRLNRALVNAVLRDDLTAIQAALADGAEVDARDPEHQETPLMLTRSEVAAALLLDHGADVNARDSRGRTAFIATRRPLLTRVGADVNAQDEEGVTALMRAVEAASIDEVRQILALGASPVQRDGEGRTALSRAEDYGLLPIAECLRRTEGDASVGRGCDLVPAVSTA